MNRPANQIGFSQRVRIEWLEYTADLVLSGKDKPSVEDALQTLLKDKVSIGGQAERGNREKIITILMKVWLTVPPELESLRVAGLGLLKRLSGHERTAVHWGMATAVYPFWSSVASQVGRLVRLQGSAAAVQVQRRVREQYGERETVSRAARRVLRSFLDWGVLKETSKKGVYTAEPPVTIEDPWLTTWLIEASLNARANRSAPLKDLLNGPNLFPFRLQPLGSDRLTAGCSKIEILRHGLDEDLVILRS